MENCNQSAERIFDIIELIAASSREMGVTEIAGSLGLAKSTVFRVLNSLLCRNYLEKNPQNDKYRLGFKFIAVAGSYMSRLDIRTASAPFIHRLTKELGVTTHIAVLRDNLAVYIEKVQPYSYSCMYSEIGKSIELYCSSLGKALLLGFSPSAYTSYLENLSAIKYTPTTLSRAELENEIEQARHTLITLDNEEHERGVFCIGTPIYDYKGQVLAAISISGMDKKLLSDSASQDALRDAGKEISKLFGGK
ncbi:MAG: IclR family transcriptional regulator [Clostridia bacterium]|nr:IclR family transcriptional regulator [Clostridia bacterium]